MKYLVTGSSGFIGTHLVKTLRQNGHDVVCFDIKDNADIQDEDQIHDLTSDVDGVFHLAAIASVQESINDPKTTHKINVEGTRNVFRAAIKNNIPVVYASSAAIYGDNQNLPLNENAPPKPLSPYAEQKLQNEKDAAHFGKERKLKSFGLRFFNIYGQGQDPSSPYSGVISIFHERISHNRQVTIFGDGQQTRDFVYVADAVHALTLAMNHTDTNAPICNICTGEKTSLINLIECFNTILNQKIAINYQANRHGDILHSLGDPNHFASMTSFTPCTHLMDGIRKLVENAA